MNPLIPILGFLGLVAVWWARRSSFSNTLPPLALSFSAAERRRLMLLDPSTATFAVELIGWARSQGLPARLGTTWRSFEDQQQAIKDKKSAIPLGSFGWHQIGRAFHINLPKLSTGKYDANSYKIIGLEARRRGGVWWGDKIIHVDHGSFQDLAHFEYHPGLTLTDLRQRQGPELVAMYAEKAQQYT